MEEERDGISRPIRFALPLLVIALLSGAGYVVHLKSVNHEADRLAALLSVPNGGTVAEIGAGKGDLVLAFAKSVSPSIHVYANEIDDAVLSCLRQAVRSSYLKNITIIRGTDSSTGLDSESCDAIVMRRVYHHLTKPQDMDRSLYRSLRKGGLLAVIDSASGGRIPPGVPSNRWGDGIRISLLIQELSRSGFQHMRTIEGWDGRYYLALFRK